MASQYEAGPAVGVLGLPDASYSDPRIADVGHELDTLLARLIILLGGDLPLQLAAINASAIGGA
jgi:hypothetical protein